MTNYSEKRRKISFWRGKKWSKIFKNLKKISIDLEWSTLAKGKVAISKTVATAAIRYDILIIIPTEYKNHIHKNTKSLSVCKCISGD